MQAAESIYPLDESHPNYGRWKRAVDTSVHRGELVCDILSDVMQLEGAEVLDIGCGVGGTSVALHNANANVTAVDRNPARLDALRKQCPEIQSRIADAEHLPFESGSFDAAVLQDVIEHTAAPRDVIMEIARILRPGGWLYLSTPNRNSLLNFFSDPHFGLPGISVLDSSDIRKVLHRLRPEDAERDDLAELLPLDALQALLHGAGLEINLMQRFVLRSMFEHPERVVWSRMHLSILRMAKLLGLPGLANLIVNDRTGFINAFVSPSWYIVARKESE